MNLPVFFPNVKYVPKIDGDSTPLYEICEAAGVSCEAIGNWTNRPIIITEGDTPSALSEPGDWGVVKITTPKGLDKRDQARWALGYLAYVLFDGVARASIKGKDWTRSEYN